MIIDFDPEPHTYKIDGVVVPSVTQVIKSQGPEFSHVEEELMERASLFGRAAHAACEQLDNNELDEPALDINLAPRVAAWHKCKSECGLVILQNEKIVGSKIWGVAGTLDRIAMVDGKFAIMDLKTCTSIHRVVGLQLSGYELCAREMGLIKKAQRVLRIAVKLKENGDYNFTPFNDSTDASVFVACVQTNHWRKNNGYK